MAPHVRQNEKTKDTFYAYLKHFAHSGILRTSCYTALIFLAFFSLGYCDDDSVQYANQWVVEIDGGDEVADDIANMYGFVNHGRLFEDENAYKFYHPRVMKRSIRESDEHNFNLKSHPLVLDVEQQVIKKRVKRGQVDFSEENQPKDPYWSKTWYLLPATQPSMKVYEAWEEGYTGEGVVVTILDDGIEYDHPDLADNYDKLASSDINDRDDNPYPRPTYSNENRHGTRCAGEVAAVANNQYCSVGIAYKASIGGVRMLDGQVTDLVEGDSISLRPNHIDIYSASWGPDDDGKTVDGPARRAKEAFAKGVETGRNGKGSIFVWASGNGGKKYDNCNCDGYTNSIYTLSISSTTENTQTPWYSEDCSSTLATTYSSGIGSEKQIVTTDLDKKCTTSHTGTSASAPLAAGICALALEANKNLTWRDMQHIVVQTANPEGLKAVDWAVNAVGRKVSHSYGYGLMDAHAMVIKAKTWKTVPQQRKCNITVLKSANDDTVFSRGKPFKITFNVDNKCEGVMPDRLEHVQAEISADCVRRGEMNIYLTSAMGTKSTLLDRRKLDSKPGGFNKWPFMTTHSWDENPAGTWTLEIVADSEIRGSGKISYFNLVLYGTLNEDWSAGIVQNGSAQGTPRSTSSYHSAETNTIGNAEVPTTTSHCKILKSKNICLVCEDGYIRSYDGLSCLTTCPKGQYMSTVWVEEENSQKVAAKIPRNDEDAKNKDSGGQLQNVCIPCEALSYCISCDGPNECLECEKGIKLIGGRCISENQELHNRIFNLTVAVCVFSIIIFVFLFVALHYCRKQNKHCCNLSSSKPLYSYVPNGIDNEDLNGARYYHNGTVGFADKNGKVSGSAPRYDHNDVKQGLLDESDDGRT